MKKTMLAVLINLCFLVTCLYANYDLQQYFPMGQQDSWVYSLTERVASQEAVKEGTIITVGFVVSGEEAVSMSGPARMFFKYSDGEQNEYSISKDSEGLKATKFVEEGDQNSVFDPPVLLLPAKFNEGETVEYSGVVTYADSNGEKKKAKIKREFSLGGIEDIETKAGMFKECYRLSIKEVFDDEKEEIKSNLYTIWLSSEVGKVKEVVKTSISRLTDGEYKEFASEETTMELEKATVNGKSFGL